MNTYGGGGSKFDSNDNKSRTINRVLSSIIHINKFH